MSADHPPIPAWLKSLDLYHVGHGGLIKVHDNGNYAGLVVRLADVLTSWGRQGEQDADRWLREELWAGHGHGPLELYGDDGEMQCATCRLDFKRDPISTLREHVHGLRLQRVAEALNGGRQGAWQPMATATMKNNVWSRVLVFDGVVRIAMPSDTNEGRLWRCEATGNYIVPKLWQPLPPRPAPPAATEEPMK